MSQSFNLNASYGLAIAISPVLSGNLRIAYSADSYLNSGATSQGIAFDTRAPPHTVPHTSSLKRKRSVSLLVDLKPPMEASTPASSSLLSRSPPMSLSVSNQPISAEPSEPGLDVSVPVPGSPVPTEIIEDATQEEIVEAIKATGVKVRDFQYESQAYLALRAPEVWRNPLHTLALFDRYVRVGPKDKPMYRLPGKMLRRLLDIGWVTPEEVARNLPDDDRRELDEYNNRPQGHYPFLISPSNSRKPSAAYRARLRDRFYPPVAGDIPEEAIYTPPDEPGMDTGPPVEEDVPATANGEADDPHMSKKRRLNEGDSNTLSRSPVSPTKLDSTGRERGPAPEFVDSAQSMDVQATPSSSQNSESVVDCRSPTPPAEEPQPPQPGLGRSQTMVFVR
ncbi:hypothetical protein AcV7_005905 [Taiwanofungus camphoratus]|nr:hypothetical protein AcV7_005905 [Antrodia cinnamomea]